MSKDKLFDRIINDASDSINTALTEVKSKFIHADDSSSDFVYHINLGKEIINVWVSKLKTLSFREFILELKSAILESQDLRLLGFKKKELFTALDGTIKFRIAKSVFAVIQEYKSEELKELAEVAGCLVSKNAKERKADESLFEFDFNSWLFDTQRWDGKDKYEYLKLISETTVLEFLEYTELRTIRNQQNNSNELPPKIELDSDNPDLNIKFNEVYYKAKYHSWSPQEKAVLMDRIESLLKDYSGYRRQFMVRLKFALKSWLEYQELKGNLTEKKEKASIHNVLVRRANGCKAIYEWLINDMHDYQPTDLTQIKDKELKELSGINLETVEGVQLLVEQMNIEKFNQAAERGKEYSLVNREHNNTIDKFSERLRLEKFSSNTVDFVKYLKTEKDILTLALENIKRNGKRGGLTNRHELYSKSLELIQNEIEEHFNLNNNPPRETNLLNQLQPAVIKLFCRLVHDSGIVPMENNINATAYTKRVCEKYGLKHADRVRQNFTFNDTKRLNLSDKHLNQVIETILPTIPKEDKEKIEIYLQSITKLYG